MGQTHEPIHYNDLVMPTRTQLQRILRDTSAEHPTTERWRDIMKRARKARGLTQGELAALIGTEQPMISEVERGTVGQSRLIPAISAALEIPVPFLMVESELDGRWMDVGRVLRRRDKEGFLRWLVLIEGEVSRDDGMDS